MSTVIAQPYSTAGNGGRKLVRLSNGWLVAVIVNDEDGLTNGTTHWRVSKDNGNTWEYVLSFNHGNSSNTSIVSYGNMVYTMVGYTKLNVTTLLIRFDATNPPSKIDGNYFYMFPSEDIVNGASLAIDPSNGHLHAAWSSKNSSYPNSFNIRYSKSTDGGVTWSAVEQLTTINVANRVAGNPSIVVDNQGNPIVLFSFNTGNSNDSENGIYVKRYTGTSWTTGILGYRMFSNSYTQSSPSAVVDKDGVIHVAWEDKQTNGGIRYSKSTDGGLSWITSYLAVTDSTNSTPSIAVDKTNKLEILYTRSSGIGRAIFTITGGQIGYATLSGAGTSNPSTLYDPTFAGEFGSVPATIYQTSTSVEYIGTYTTNQAPTLTLNTTDNFTLSESAGQNELLVDGSTIDSDPNNTVTAKMQINDSTIRNIASGISDGLSPIEFSKQLTYRNKRIYDGVTPLSSDLAENVDHKLKVWVDDGQGGISVIAERKFRVIHNRPPVISDTDRDLGTLIESPSVTYQVNDLEGQAVTVTEKVNGQVIRSFEATPNTDYTLEIPLEMWIPLQLQQHNLTVEATDPFGAKTTRTYTFTRTEDTILLELKNPFETDIAATRILVTPEVYVPIGSTIKIEACNNAFDDVPTWEDITSMAMNKRGFSFTNQAKTADQWGINIRFTLEKGTATQEVRLDGFGGAFD